MKKTRQLPVTGAFKLPSGESKSKDQIAEILNEARDPGYVVQMRCPCGFGPDDCNSLGGRPEWRRVRSDRANHVNVHCKEAGYPSSADIFDMAKSSNYESGFQDDNGESLGDPTEAEIAAAEKARK